MPPWPLSWGITTLRRIFLKEYFFTRYKKSEKSLSSLKKLAGRNSVVLRDGKEQIVKSSEVVVGDILVLKSGDIVNGDARIIDDNNLEVDESSLTGESISVIKNSHLIEEKELVISECSNIVFSGTMITNGVGKAIIYAVGGNTEIGKIALAINESKEEKTPLEESLDSFSKYLALGIILNHLRINADDNFEISVF